MAPPTVHLRPARGWASLDFSELYAYRELLLFLIWRDVKVRYKHTALGGAWAVIQPLLTMVVFSIFFGQLARIPSDGIPYPVFAFAGLLPWQLFAHAITESGNSVVANQNLVSKVYLPRLLIPVAAVMGGLVDFGVAFAVLLALMAWSAIVPGFALIALPAFILLALTAAAGVGLWLSALNVQYRDVRYTLPFLTQLWLFATPVAYPASLVPAEWRWLMGLNPMAGVVEGFRWSLLGGPAPGPLTLVAAAVAALLAVSGLYYFRRMERDFADVL